MNETRNAVVPRELEGERADVAASDLFGITRNAASTYIGDGVLTLDGSVIKKNYKVSAGDVLCLRQQPLKQPDVTPQDIPLRFVYEDDVLAVVDKPKGMVVHPAPGNYEGTLVSALLYHMKGQLSGINGVERPGIVHRIDKDTSGLLIVAKTDEAHVGLAEQIKEHSFMRRYEGIIVGRTKEDSGSVDKPIDRDPKDRKRMAAGIATGRQARTDYELIEPYKGFSHMLFTLHTGRTHQIRAHMKSIGHPLMGDIVYGAGKTDVEKKYASLIRGQVLHARYIGFVHPKTGEYMEFDAGLPEYFTETEKILRQL